MAIKKERTGRRFPSNGARSIRSFPIVGVGSSALDLEALSEMLTALPADSGMALVFVEHLGAERQSVLAALLERKSSLPVLPVMDGMAVQPNHVYVTPADGRTSLKNGIFRLSARAAANFPIDHFLQSLAADCQDAAIGVLLSANSTDGAAGLEAIRAQGGICFGHDHAPAAFSAAPGSAVNSRTLDFALPPHKIAAELLRIARSKPLISRRSDDSPAWESEQALRELLLLLRKQSGVDFTQFKPEMIHARIARRMLLKKFLIEATYVQFAQKDAAELEALFQDMLAHVTGFFSDRQAFEVLEGRIFPLLMKQLRAEARLRVWVPGCSTGEEAYSVAMVLSEYLHEHRTKLTVRIFATDINESFIRQARAGAYASRKLAHLSAERLQHFFVERRDGYQVREFIRDMCTFARHDLARDPPFSHIDLVSCQNVLAQFEPALQKKVVADFHYSLHKGGLLLTGETDTLKAFPHLFGPAETDAPFYSKKDLPKGSLPLGKAGADLPREVERNGSSLLFKKAAKTSRGSSQSKSKTLTDRDARNEELRALNEEFVANNEELQSANEQLETAREELQSANQELVTLSEQQASRNAELARTNDDLTNVLDGVQVPILLLGSDRHIRRFTRSAARMFNLLPSDVGRAIDDLRSNLDLPDLPQLIARAVETLIPQEREVRDLRGRYYSMSVRPYRRHDRKIDGVLIALFDTDAMKRSIEETRRARDYALAIVETVREPLIVLDSRFRVVTANRSFFSAFELVPEEVHQHSIFEVAEGAWNDAGLHQLLEKLLPENAPFSDFKLSAAFPKAGFRRLVLNARRLQWEGHAPGMILVAVEDLTERELTTEALRQSRERLRHLTAGLITAQEEERKRISRDLHDDLNQRLAMITVELETLERKPPRAAEVRRQRLAAVRSRIAGISDDIRQTAHQLHPSTVDHLGLSAAMRSLCADVAKSENLQVHCRERNADRTVPAEVALCLYRVAQEAIHNVVKHSGARRISISLINGKNRILLSVRDAGRGFDCELTRTNKGLGIVNMEERARLVGGKLSIRSSAGKGTRVVLEVPILEAVS